MQATVWVVLCALGLARSGEGARPSPSPVGARKGDAIVQRNVFCSRCAESPPEPAAAPLALELVAILSSPTGPTGPTGSLAVIVSQRDHSTALYAQGDRVDGAEVLTIGRRRVTLRHRGRLATLTLDLPAATPGGVPVAARATAVEVRCTGGRCEIPRAVVARVLADPAALAPTVRVMPHAKGGLSLAFVRPESLLAQLGLESGDHLRAVNRVELHGIEQMLDLYRTLRHASAVSLSVERKGRPLTLDVVIR